MAKKRILVVDDERDIVEIVRELLEGEGYETFPAYDGVEALEAAKTGRPDGIVMDIKMPGLDGIEVIRRLRADPTLFSTPVVVLTATQVIRESSEQFQQLNVHRWISKPFEPEDLIRAVAGAVKKPHA